MSRIGRKPIPLPDKVKVDIREDTVVVTGPKGTVTNPIPPGIRFEEKDKQLHAIRQAVEMEVAERRSRMRRMRLHVREHNIYSWAGMLLAELARIPSVSASAVRPNP